METPEFIRAAYAPVENETPEQRRKRLASKRAAKYRYFGKVDDEKREQSKDRQRRWRETLDADKLDTIREQNRLRQQARRGKMTVDDKKRRNQQQRQRRAVMDELALQSLREREKLRMRRRRDKHAAGSAGSGSQSEDGSVPPLATTVAVGGEGARRHERPRQSSPLLMGVFTPTAVAPLPQAAALGLTNAIRGDASSDQIQLSIGVGSAARHQPQVQHHHPPIEIAPLQFVLPPASSIQSLTFADRTMAPLPQVQNVLPHASTLLNAAAPQTQQQSVPLSMQSSSSSMGPASGSLANAPAPPTSSVGAASLSSQFMFAPSSSSFLGSLLNPPALPLPPHIQGIPAQSNPQGQAVLPSLSQLPDLLATTANVRDYFDSTSTAASGYFPSIADFTGDFETTFRT